MSRKGSTDAWKRNLAEATADPKPTPAPTESTEATVALGTYVPRSVHLAVRSLALELEADRGRRVTVAELVTEALGDLLAKYGRA